jgi:signal-transduction protein with cAMP-binding, CBS, and nucleotidyltransferase domain
MVLSRILRILRRQTLFQSLIRKFYLRRIAGLYESGRARYIAARFTISTFLSKQTGKSFEKSLIDRALSYYDAVRKKAVDDIREITATFPEYVERAQALLATTIEHSQQERKIFELADLGILNDKVKLDLLDAIDRQIRGLASRPLQGLEFDPEELLVKVPLFAGLSVRQRKKISTLFKTLTLPKGEVLFNQGDDGDSLYIVARGTVEIVRNSRKVSVLSAGAFFGELALLSSIPRTATVTTVHPSILLELSKSKFDRLLDSDQNLKRHIQKVGERRLAEVKKG